MTGQENHNTSGGNSLASHRACRICHTGTNYHQNLACLRNRRRTVDSVHSYNGEAQILIKLHPHPGSPDFLNTLQTRIKPVQVGTADRRNYFQLPLKLRRKDLPQSTWALAIHLTSF